LLQPEIAELEVYPALRPETREWVADDVLMKADGKMLVPAGAHKLRFTIESREPGVSPLALIYRWRIPGWAEGWRETGSDGRVELVPPPPSGIYQLQVQARHTDGVWDESARPITFQVAVPWWRDPFMAGFVFGGSALFAGALWWRVGAWRVHRRLVVAEHNLELHRERLRIARDMHDEIGARLTYIALLADRAGREGQKSAVQLEELATNARSAVSALDDIVWAVNPQNETVASLADYLYDYAPGYLQPAGIECRLDLQLAHPKRPLNLTARQGLLMAVKEALQNVVKHAQATAVRISMQDRGERLEIVVADNGRGIGSASAGISHTGLEQMRQRLAELGGKCDIGPGEGGSGTRVFLVLPLHSSHSKLSMTA
jgi:signal transduction histidine kinase